MSLSPPRTLAALGTDVLVNIVKFSMPRDIISLRRTCKSLSHVTRLRTIWIDALRTIMARYLISEAVFPLQTMSLSMLEYAALSPLRFASLLEQYHGGSTEPTYIRPMSTRLTNEEKIKYGIPNAGRFHDILMAPGGRHLLSISSHESSQASLLTIWDLGLSGTEPVRPVVRFMCPTQRMESRCFLVDHKNPEILYLASLQQSPSLLLVLIHKVSLFDTPEISFLRRLEIPASPGCADFSVAVVPKSCKVVVSSYYERKFNLWVWDILDNAATIFATPVRPFTEDTTIFPYEDCIMVAIEGQILVYNIPPLVPRDSGLPLAIFSPAIIIAPPSYSSDAFIVREDLEVPILSPSPDLPRYILRVDVDQLLVLEIEDNNPRQVFRIPNKLPILTDTINFRDPEAREAASLGFARKCEDQLFIVIREATAFSVYGLDARRMFDFDRYNEAGAWFACARLKYSISIGLPIIEQFSPLLGRFCVLTQTGDVYVFDYLVPPEERDT